MAVLFYSLSIAAQSLVASAALGGRKGEARQITQRLCEICVVAAGALTVTMLAGRAQVVSLFTKDAAVRAAALGAWPALLFGLVPDGVASVQEGVLLGAGDHRGVALLTMGASAWSALSLAALWYVSPSLNSIWLGLRVISVARVVAAFRKLRAPGGLFHEEEEGDDVGEGTMGSGGPATAEALG